MLPIIGAISGIINKLIPDQDLAKKLELELGKEVTKQAEMQKEIIAAEIKQGGITAKWRPYTAICFVLMLVGHWFMYDVTPFIITTFDLNSITPQDPGYTDGLLEVVKICLGGYIFSRSAEKGLSTWKRK